MLKINNLKYTYYIIRHGQSTPNIDKIIISKLKNGILPQYGLTEIGRKQCLDSAQSFLDKLNKSNETIDQFVIAYSPFSRTKETAQEIAKILPHSQMIKVENLRERDFGDMELTGNENYDKFWEQDKNNADSIIFNSESPNQVLTRVMSVIEDIETYDYPKNQKIILTSHGDTLQILQTYFSGLPASKHHTDVSYMQNAEIRKLN